MFENLKSIGTVIQDIRKDQVKFHHCVCINGVTKIHDLAPKSEETIRTIEFSCVPELKSVLLR